jgi:hypothetical protein
MERCPVRYVCVMPGSRESLAKHHSVHRDVPTEHAYLALAETRPDAFATRVSLSLRLEYHLNDFRLGWDGLLIFDLQLELSAQWRVRCPLWSSVVRLSVLEWKSVFLRALVRQCDRFLRVIPMQ